MDSFIISAFADEASSDLFEQMRICNNNSIKFIELRNVSGKSIVDFDLKEVAEIKKNLDDKGFKISSLGSPFGKINIKDDFEIHLEKFKKAIEMAHILDTKLMRIFSFYIDDNVNAEEYKNEVIHRLGVFLDNSNGIQCCHENEKGIYGDTSSRCKTLYDAFDGKLKLIFDPANFVQCEVDTIEAFNFLGDYTEYLHIKDALKSTKAVVPAGYGDGNLEEIINRFSKKAGTKFLSIEPHLKVFDGFSSLEKDDVSVVEEYTYKSNEEAFNTAANSLKEILCVNGFTQTKDLKRGYGEWIK